MVGRTPHRRRRQSPPLNPDDEELSSSISAHSRPGALVRLYPKAEPERSAGVQFGVPSRWLTRPQTEARLSEGHDHRAPRAKRGTPGRAPAHVNRGRTGSRPVRPRVDRPHQFVHPIRGRRPMPPEDVRGTRAGGTRAGREEAWRGPVCKGRDDEFAPRIPETEGEALERHRGGGVTKVAAGRSDRGDRGGRPRRTEGSRRPRRGDRRRRAALGGGPRDRTAQARTSSNAVEVIVQVIKEHLGTKGHALAI
jgi:hypothetical protein